MRLSSIVVITSALLLAGFGSSTPIQRGADGAASVAARRSLSKNDNEIRARTWGGRNVEQLTARRLSSDERKYYPRRFPINYEIEEIEHDPTVRPEWMDRQPPPPRQQSQQSQRDQQEPRNRQHRSQVSNNSPHPRNARSMS
ncbi:hypothetical protein AMATHDRAFT_6735 [Amanita thiersii Skay4041]|uniref:Uncharacterized protein n=1 Tax=Amanita thiersii Skay4041 TaxID=703135 RepID=A0A2A9NIE8_9AGAR|nr:hypothetical protein AMATHDRAFT_6735 [Amanita thiersii Skay4041]